MFILIIIKIIEVTKIIINIINRSKDLSIFIYSILYIITIDEIINTVLINKKDIQSK